MDPLPIEVYSAASVRAMDRRAIEQAGIPGYVLMQRAGEAAFAALRRHWPAARSIGVYCGPGNNAGDGYLVARLARAAGLEVRVIAVADPQRLGGDAARAWADFAAEGGQVEALQAATLPGLDVVVDALLGTGVDRPAEGAMRTAILQLARQRAPVFALDIPSGLDADTGLAHGGLAVRATRTIAFVALKSGYFLGEAPDHVGELAFAGLGIPDAARSAESPVMRRLDGRAAAALPPLPRSSHKGSRGRVTIVGGLAMPGAARLAGEAALRAGAGLVTLVTAAAAAPSILATRPELIVRDAASPAGIEAIAGADAVAIGPGLGTGAEAARLFAAVLDAGRPLVVDADALGLLAGHPRKSGDWILTPHPGEAARLLGLGTDDVQRDRLAAVRAIVERYGGCCVLKGANTLVQGDGLLPAVCDRGNPGMATAGSGDVLTGIVAALLAGTREPLLAAGAGVFLHAEAGDRAARAGMRGMVAGDIVAELRGVVNQPWR